MRSLALKIFLGFWIIHALIFVSLALLPNANQTTRLLDVVRRDGTLAAELYEGEDPSACARFLAAVGRTQSAEITVYNDALLPVCRSRSDIDDKAYRALVAAVTTEGQVTKVSGREVCVTAVTTRAGREYRLAMAAASAEPLDPWRPRVPLGALLAVVLLSGVVCLVLARYLAAPLRKMREATHRLREGDLAARAGVESRNDEIGDVVRDFDLMADRIQSLVEGQKHLLSAISHELRSPLARLGVAVELARRTTGPAAGPHLTRIETEAARMNDLIDTLLKLSRADALESPVQLNPFDLAEVLHQVVEDADYEASRTGRRVHLTGETSATALGDPSLAATAIDNILRNAVRHTPAGSSVDVVLSQSSDSTRVVVRDHGPGVPDQELERIFQPLYRLDASRNRESGGIGLGLAIARGSVGQMRGTITAANDPGGGLAVTISLPRADSSRA